MLSSCFGHFLLQVSVFHRGSISLIEEPCISTHLAALKIAKESGCILSYDPNLRLPLWPSADAARQGIMSIWNQADIIKVSEEEISYLTGGDPYDDDAVYKKPFHPNLRLLVTEGQEGCRYYTKKFNSKVKAIKVKCVDTTGAGDAFDEKNLREGLMFANACRALTVTERGAIPALPTRDAVLDFLPKASEQPHCFCMMC
uniref:Probable fructokinase-7 n=1 Tax=Elaeis guineensis var. tenera TaxID=51953 RepID=A0A6J0PJH1_ELAGV|nr:probable fructokinase-7 [Elaeis guineensis]